MRILLDACVVVWMAEGSPEISQSARDHFENPDNELLLSVVSVWEIVIKYGLGKLELASPPEEIVPALRRDFGIQSLALDEEAALAVRRLPGLHRDPFDRMLVSQAITHGLTILTPDPLIRQYPVRILW
jgi:PIN domain nuclease of toxin-antitoxin system